MKALSVSAFVIGSLLSFTSLADTLDVSIYGLADNGSRIDLEKFKSAIPSKKDGQIYKVESNIFSHAGIPVLLKHERPFSYIGKAVCKKGRCDLTRNSVKLGYTFAYQIRDQGNGNIDDGLFHIDVKSKYNEVIAMRQKGSLNAEEPIVMKPDMRHFDVDFSAIIKKNERYSYFISKGSCSQTKMVKPTGTSLAENGDCLSLYMDLKII